MVNSAVAANKNLASYEFTLKDNNDSIDAVYYEIVSFSWIY